MKYILLVSLILGSVFADQAPLVYKELSKEVFDSYKGTDVLLKQKALDEDRQQLAKINKKMGQLLDLAYEVDDEYLPQEYKRKSKEYLKALRGSQQSLDLYNELIKKYVLQSIETRPEAFDRLIVYAQSSLQKDHSFRKKVLCYYSSADKNNNAYLNLLIKHSSAQERYLYAKRRSSDSINGLKTRTSSVAINRRTQSFEELESLISRLQAQQRLPIKMPFISRVNRTRHVSFQTLKSGSLSKRGTSHQDLKCFENNHLDGLVGNDLNNKVYCSEERKWILSGKGEDELNLYGKGLYVISPGLGNDNIMHQSNSVVIVMNQNWGHDDISNPSANSDFLPDNWHSKPVHRDELQETLKKHAISKPANWKFRYTNFIVFGKGISPYDLEIDEYSIKNIKTGDTIDFEYRPYYNLVFADSPLVLNAF